MSFAIVSFVSSTNVIALGSWSNDQEPNFFVWEESHSEDNIEFSSELGDLWQRVQDSAPKSFDLSQLTELYCVSGPGSFTGIRVGASFVLGLARGLEIPCYAIPTYSIFKKPVGIPLRPKHVSALSYKEVLDSNYEFMFSESAKITTRTPANGDCLLGPNDVADEYKKWPTKEQMLLGLLKSKSDPAPFKPEYGVEPKVFGKRLKS